MHLSHDGDLCCIPGVPRHRSVRPAERRLGYVVERYDLAFFALHTAPKTPAGDPLEEMAVAVADTPETLPSLHELLASEEHSIWLEADPSSLF